MQLLHRGDVLLDHTHSETMIVMILILRNVTMLISQDVCEDVPEEVCETVMEKSCRTVQEEVETFHINVQHGIKLF